MADYWTDYPFVEMGDAPYRAAPIRSVELRSYDGDKYVRVRMEESVFEIKSGYIYTKPGRCGEAPKVPLSVLRELPVTEPSAPGRDAWTFLT